MASISKAAHNVWCRAVHRRELNLAQLPKETYGEEVFNVGFTTYEGTGLRHRFSFNEMELRLFILLFFKCWLTRRPGSTFCFIAHPFQNHSLPPPLQKKKFSPHQNGKYSTTFPRARLPKIPRPHSLPQGYPPAGNTSASRERGLLRGGIPPGTEAGHSDFMVVFRGSGELVDAMHEEGLVECVIGEV
ncbi:hypothetical protein BC936DRAFT_147126 [Jimgerdemannia flammicorona]|uniref:Uncharacterized protein n=1 Tax=Jimgerdemannia flammicorona TaxID=994334 RepID=A0A433D650_9FUNG|nr:hypothetical protein BC936DRAFT_147126 [Jimgerdemannia flammicorona]